MANVIKNFFQRSEWTCPAGVTKVKVIGRKQRNSFIRNGAGFIDQYGALYTWGINGGGQLGDGTVVPKSSPVACLGGIVFSRVVSSQQSLAPTYFGISTTGLAYAWGNNGSVISVLGDGTIVPKSSPVLISGGLSFVDFWTSPQQGSVIGLTQNGAAYAWGDNTQGVLGDGTTTKKSVPTLISGGLKWTKFDVGNSTAYGITKDGLLYSWGLNNFGELGDGTTNQRSAPGTVLGNLIWGSVKTMHTPIGAAFAAGITKSGDVYGWGRNSSGQIGDGTTVDKSSPALALGGIKFQDIQMTGNPSVIGLAMNGDCYAWGNNDYGQLGTNDTTQRSTPTLVVGGKKFTKIATTQSTGFVAVAGVYGLTRDGALYSWGSNFTGEVGDGTVTQRSSPTLVLGGLNIVDFNVVSDIDSGGVSRCTIHVLTSDGQVYMWGHANYMADGTNTTRSSPVAIVGLRTANIDDVVKEAYVPVTPGTTYPITVNSISSTFGNVVVGNQCTVITLEYEA